ncbi:MAG: hypothetical protein IKA05_09825 [Clostridia bacterium]|nr:hypothetical protein [Clostridia bacterium]
MKRRILKKSVACLLLLAMLTGVLTSCGFEVHRINLMKLPKRVETLMNRSTEVFEEADSYTLDLEMELRGLVSGVGTTATATGTMQYVGLLEGEYGFWSQLQTTVSVEGMSQKQTVKQSDGFVNGKGIYYYEGGGVRQGLWSEMTKEAYLASREDAKSDLMPDFEKLEGSEAETSCIYEKGEGWTVQFDNFDETAVEELMKLFGGMDSLLGEEEIESLSFRFRIGEDLTPLSFSVEIIGEKPEFSDPTTLKVTATFCDINKTEIEEIDLSAYTEVDDIRVLSMFSKALEDAGNREEGHFRLLIHQDYDIKSTDTEMFEEDSVNFYQKDGKYSYEVKAKLASGNVYIYYEDGKKQVLSSGRENTSESDDETEKAFIDKLIDQGSFALNLNRVSDITVKDAEDGIYELEVENPYFSGMPSLEELAGAYASDSKGVYTVTIRNGELIEYTYSLDVEFPGKAGRTYYYRMTCTYRMVEEEIKI